MDKSIKEIINSYQDQKEIELKGWITSNRGNNKIRFISLNDGSTILNIQIVFNQEKFDLEEIEKWKIGSALNIRGIFKLTPNAKQSCEIEAIEANNISPTDDSFPIQKQEINLETLREIPHIRHRTNIFRAIMLIRSTLAKEIHNFFDSEGFMYLHTPIITSNDGEGAGEGFIVDDENKELFFSKKATLAVTGQLHGESYATGFTKIYTFGPTFRAEKSNTKRHAAEFWMIEPEVAFYELNDIIHLSDRMLKYVIKKTLEKHPEEFKFLDERQEGRLIKNLETFLNKKLQILEYSQAIEMLKKVKEKFVEKNIEYGLDLATEHEKYLADEVFQGPVAIINYPKEFKAFYMYLNNDGKSVAAFDLLVPGVGELIGGSQREVDIEKLKSRMSYYNISIEEMQWYLDLRRFGDAGSSGFGLGFERLVMYVTGIDNIRDSIPYPRTFGNLKM
ncbi:asparagine--tRNA ligase [Mesomycoplasma moatsii]|uniref:asparagine--tRNA ligase n=1 Tax=Mesomycoplasma moatsii TaxID=171287 RepID=UPI0003B4638E